MLKKRKRHIRITIVSCNDSSLPKWKRRITQGQRKVTLHLTRFDYLKSHTIPFLCTIKQTRVKFDLSVITGILIPRCCKTRSAMVFVTTTFIGLLHHLTNIFVLTLQETRHLHLNDIKLGTFKSVSRSMISQ